MSWLSRNRATVFIVTVAVGAALAYALLAGLPVQVGLFFTLMHKRHHKRPTFITFEPRF